MDLTQAIYRRRAVREFTEKPVDEKTIRRLIDAAVQAPSAINRQPWSFCVVRDKAVLSKISENAKTHLLETAPPDLESPHIQDMLRDKSFDIFYGAPALIVIAAEGPSEWAVEDCTLAAQNLMLAACNIGVGSCWIGLAQSWLRSEDGVKTLELPEGHVPVAPIIIGYPPVWPPEVPRQSPDIRWIG
ncbi:nitroreductase [Methyloligella sp. 2.7D]|uniref:nitroreductase family protein n=1 Tax=unclassified Methyloligella TaxID=2625955 RepID=UPI00157C06F2|nr:nitroreductase [Methyloligella sp. GL2]QKP76773.1 nitroreductase [Methyloligella sp. GL2]